MGVRAQIEEVIRGLRGSIRAWAGCHARSEKVNSISMACCLVTRCVLERERYDLHLSIDNLKRQLTLKGRSRALPTLERL